MQPFPSPAAVDRRQVLLTAQMWAQEVMRRHDYKAGVQAWETVLNMDDTDAFAWCELGTCWLNLQRDAEAKACFKQALRIKRNYVAPRIALADLETFAKPPRPRKALQILERALAFLRPSDPQRVVYLVSRANALHELRRYGEAEAAARLATDTKPDFAPAWAILGNILVADGRNEEARSITRKAWELSQDSRLGMNHALTCLALGDWAEGWRAYAERLRDPNHEGYRRFEPAPYWDGTPLDGNLVIYCEQGLGDLIQFSRFIPEIVKRVTGKVYLECWPLHIPLVEAMGLPVVILPMALMNAPRVHFDRWMALMSAMPYVSPAINDVPAAVPFNLEAEAMGEDSCAVIWYGNPEFGGAEERDIPLRQFRPIFERYPKWRFWTPLPENRAKSDIARLGVPVEVVSGTILGAARKLKGSRRVLACDTGTMHLAASLGVETHLFRPKHWDWRWQNGSKTPWYPSLTIHAQTVAGDWSAVRGFQV